MKIFGNASRVALTVGLLLCAVAAAAAAALVWARPGRDRVGAHSTLDEELARHGVADVVKGGVPHYDTLLCAVDGIRIWHRSIRRRPVGGPVQMAAGEHGSAVYVLSEEGHLGTMPSNVSFFPYTPRAHVLADSVLLITHKSRANPEDKADGIEDTVSAYVVTDSECTLAFEAIFDSTSARDGAVWQQFFVPSRNVVRGQTLLLHLEQHLPEGGAAYDLHDSVLRGVYRLDEETRQFVPAHEDDAQAPEAVPG